MNNQIATRRLALLFALTVGSTASGADPVKFATNWRAQAEHGGFYQALADGTYADAGLNVTIVQGGPMVNNRAQLVVGRIDFYMGSNLIQTFDAVKQGLPTVTVAGFFQRDVQCLIAHPDAGNEAWRDLPKAPILVGASGRQTYFRWLSAKHGFQDSNVRNYTFNMAPFLTDKRAVQQGFATAEPMAIAKALGHEPRVFLLADHGWNTYSTLIDTRAELVRDNPGLVQRFLDASIVGWVRYLYGDPSAAHELIRKENPQMPVEQLDYSRRQMIDRGIVDSGETLTKGIGAMDAERVASFLAAVTEAGLYVPGEVDPDKGTALEFVNKGVGLDEKRRLLAEAGPSGDAPTAAP
ncbi:MAG: ABC transporter substrate-binding protein [Lacipirellulaceae bacterium]